MIWILIAAAIVVGVLSWTLIRRFTSDHLQKLNDERRATSRLVSRGEFVDGSRHMEVALALTDSAFYYENSEVHASLDLEWVEEVDYDSELATGRSITNGEVLRLRCHRQVFEFILANDVVPAWKAVLPARRPANAGVPANALVAEVA